MKHLKLFESYSIYKMLSSYNITDYLLNNDGTVDGDDIDLSSNNLLKIPIKFNEVENFNCSFNTLKALENSPNYVNGNFDCSNNALTTLLEGPSYVKGDYYCNNNNLRDSYGFPESFVGELFIYNNPINEIISIVPKDKKINFIKFLNLYKVIKDGNIIFQSKLEQALNEVGLDRGRFRFKNYKML